MARDPEGFTPIQRKMIGVLADGKPHSKEELHACLDDELSPLSAIRAHLTSIRKVLGPRGEDVVCVIVHRKTMYRHMRLLQNPYLD